MDWKAAILALLGAWGMATGAPQPAYAQAGTSTASETSSNPLLNRIWVRADEKTLPGPMQIFLEDGTLVTDSCWETYRLSRWQQVSESEISWEEDGVTISADIATLTDAELVLRLNLIGGEVDEQHYVPAVVPYVCPDMEK